MPRKSFALDVFKIFCFHFVVTPYIFKVHQAFYAKMNFRSFFVVDFKDASNWVALAIAIPLLVWGVRMIMRAV